MTTERLFENNRRWAAEMARRDPDTFRRLAGGQAPPYLWIGCSDSRVPASQVVGLGPGEVFVHRNVANLVVAEDPNGQAALRFAVEVLQVDHVIVCGHYDCGGMLAALRDGDAGLPEGWLRHLREVRRKHEGALAELASEAERHDRLCELNVLEQVERVNRTAPVRRAREEGRALEVHGWIFDPRDGLIRDLDT